MRIDITKDKQVTQHFNTKEARDVSHSKAKDVDARLFEIAEIVRKYAGNAPIKISSAVRTWGVKNSAHLRGNAFDLDLNENQLRSLRDTQSTWIPLAYSVGLRGLGTYWTTTKTFIHVDTEHQNIKSRWLVGDKTYPFRYWNEGPAWLQRAGAAGPDDHIQALNTTRVTQPTAAEISEANDEKKADNKGLNTLFIAVTALLLYFIVR